MAVDKNKGHHVLIDDDQEWVSREKWWMGNARIPMWLVGLGSMGAVSQIAMVLLLVSAQSPSPTFSKLGMLEGHFVWETDEGVPPCGPICDKEMSCTSATWSRVSSGTRSCALPFMALRPSPKSWILGSGTQLDHVGKFMATVASSREIMVNRMMEESFLHWASLVLDFQLTLQGSQVAAAPAFIEVTSLTKAAQLYYGVHQEAAKATKLAASDYQDALAVAFFRAAGWPVQSDGVGLRGGTFLEMGADDGIAGSNTYHFEQRHGWAGFLIEPASQQVDKIASNRNGTLARVACPRAVCEHAGDITLYNQGQVASTVHAVDRLDIQWKVPCKPLKEILMELNGGTPPPALDLWSLDCEGCERVALETFAWQDTEVGLLIVEAAAHSCAGDPEYCRSLLRGHGMRLWAVGTDEFWFSPTYLRKRGWIEPTADQSVIDSIITQVHANWQSHMDRRAAAEMLVTAFNDRPPSWVAHFSRL